MFLTAKMHTLLALILLTSVASCGAPSASNPTCGDPKRTGITDCPTYNIQCQIGSYCNPKAASNSYCLNGCASDANCASNQHCLKCDATSSYGTCQDCSVTACVSTCAATSGDARCLSPGTTYDCKNPADRPPAAAGSCKELDIGLYCCGGQVNPCTRSLPADPLCMGRPSSKAYECPPDAAAPGCSPSGSNPLVYCCP